MRWFALAKAYKDIGKNALCFDCLLRGNSLKRRTVNFNEIESVGVHSQAKRLMSAATIRSATGRGDHSPRPIFISGMPRSGSRPMEQSLASLHW